MPIGPAHLARSLGALDTLDVERGFTGTLQQVLRSATTLLDADMAGLSLVDHAGVLRWASTSAPMLETHEGDLERLARGPCRAAFAQRAPVAVPDRGAEPGWSGLATSGIDTGIHAGLSVPVQIGGGPVGTLDVYATAPREWDDSEAAALQAYAGLVASLLAAAVTARVAGRLADQVRAAVDRLLQARAQRREATDREVALHRRDSELHEGAARRYERGGQPGRAQTERLQAAAARGRIIDAEAVRRRADREP